MIPRAKCIQCGFSYAAEWAGTTCSNCDGDIVTTPVETSADDQLFQAFLKFTQQRGRHEGEHVFNVTACSQCEKAYVDAEDALAAAVHEWIDAKQG